MSLLPRFTFRRSDSDTSRRPNRRRRAQSTGTAALDGSAVTAPNFNAEPEPPAEGPFQPLPRNLPLSRPAGQGTAAFGEYEGSQVCFGGGVAIFHLSTARVVVCYHPRHRVRFLPKGRKDEGEEAGAGAEREGYEESGYRNRLLPLPVAHRQPPPAGQARDPTRFSTEPVLVQLMPWSRTARHGQYILSWRIAETLPPADEAAVDAAPPPATPDPSAPPGAPAPPAPYRAPPAYPAGLTLRARIALDRAPDGRPCEPVRHEGTGVDADELTYQAQLLPVAQAMRRLEGTGQDLVVRRGWEAICLRDRLEVDAAER